MRSLNIFLSVLITLATLVLSTAPAQARFLQTDPVGYADQMNMYNYVHNDPINNTDPTGMETLGMHYARLDDIAYLNGQMSQSELMARRHARTTGAVSGLGGVACAIGCKAAAVGAGAAYNQIGIQVGVRLPWLFPAGTGAANLSHGFANPGAQSYGAPLVLGFKSHGLEAFVSKIGGRHLMGGTATQAELDVMAALADPASDIMVRLDGFAGSTPQEMFDGMVALGRQAVATGKTGDGVTTSREMFRIRESGRVADVTFTLGEEVVKVE